MENSIMSEQETQGRVDGASPLYDGQSSAVQAGQQGDGTPSAVTGGATVHTQTHEALAKPVHVLPASRPDTPAPVQNPVTPPANDSGMTFKELSQMAGAMVFVIGFVALGLHAIYYAGY
ncbi:hypothetical protein AA0474_2486 [Acetobacter lovaniensis NRIC 0474]|nr:hypothetical protein AA0474_2486 [Acetobacter lovaniensis NRIC 0474]